MIRNNKCYRYFPCRIRRELLLLSFFMCMASSISVAQKTVNDRHVIVQSYDTSLLHDFDLGDVMRDNQVPVEAVSAVKDFEKSLQDQLSSLQRAASNSIEHINTVIEHKAVQIKEASAQDAQRLLQAAEEETKKLLDQAKVQTEAIARQLELKAYALKKEAAIRAIDIINEAEAAVVRERQKKRKQKAIAQVSRKVYVEQPGREGAYINFRLPTHVEDAVHVWRTSISKEFGECNALMQQIIIDGEDPTHAQDFKNRFKIQHEWFDQTLRGTQRLHDASYNKIMKKQQTLRSIMQAQREADLLLAEISQRLTATPAEHKKIRLLVLYELHALVQQALQAPMRTDVAEIRIEDGASMVVIKPSTIKTIVFTMAHEVTGRVTTFYPDFIPVVLSDLLQPLPASVVSQSVQSVLPAPGQTVDSQPSSMPSQAIQAMPLSVPPHPVDASSDMAKTPLSTYALPKHIKKEMRSRINEKSKEALEARLLVKELERKISRLQEQSEKEKIMAEQEKEETIRRVRKEVKEQYIPQLEAKDREALEFKLQLTEAEKKMHKLYKKVNRAQQELKKMEGEVVQLKHEADTAKGLAEKLAHDLKHEKKARLILAEKNSLVEDLSTRLIDEYARHAHGRLHVQRAHAEQLELTYKEKKELLKKMQEDVAQKESYLKEKEKNISEQAQAVKKMYDSIEQEQQALRALQESAQTIFTVQKDLLKHEREGVNKKKIKVDLQRQGNIEHDVLQHNKDINHKKNEIEQKNRILLEEDIQLLAAQAKNQRFSDMDDDFIDDDK